jgi:hypothetical protein
MLHSLAIIATFSRFVKGKIKNCPGKKPVVFPKILWYNE